jgi:hypothetical protein
MAVSLRVLVQRFGEYKEVPSRPDEVRFCCPYCVEIGKLPDKKFHLYINLIMGVGYCFRCNKIIYFNNNLQKTQNFYLDNSTVNLQTKQVKSSFDEVPENISIFKSEEGLKFLKYKLQHYNWYYVEEFLREFDVRVCVDERYKHLFGRIMFPIKFNGELVGFQFRSIYGEEPKYFSYGYKGRNIKHYVYNYDLAKENNEVIICEGVFDILPFYRKAIAVFGKNLTPLQKRLIANTWESVIIGLDGDAFKEATGLGLELWKMGLKDVKVLDLRNTEKDPCDLGFEILHYPILNILDVENF